MAQQWLALRELLSEDFLAFLDWQVFHRDSVQAVNHAGVVVVVVHDHDSFSDQDEVWMRHVKCASTVRDKRNGRNGLNLCRIGDKLTMENCTRDFRPLEVR